MTTEPASPGRPPVLDDTLRTAYLAGLRAGLTKQEAAEHCGLTSRGIAKAAGRDRAFAAARAKAAAAGRQARTAGIPHGEYRYIHHDCRCNQCTREATAARMARKEGRCATVVALTGPATSATDNPVFPLARAS